MALGSVWKRGLLPKELENHILMTWLAYENGNVRRLSDTIGLHGNTLILNFKKKAKNLRRSNLGLFGERYNRRKPKDIFPISFLNSIIG